MPNFKMTLEFEALGDQDAGWTESYWNTFGNIGAAVQGIVALGAARGACLVASVNMPWGRIAQVPAGSDIATIINFRKSGSTQPVGLLSGVADKQEVKGLLRLVNGLGTYTKQPFGGIPSTNFGTNGAYIPGGAFAAPFAAFLTFLTSAGYCTRKIAQGTAPYPNGGANQKYLISSIAVGGAVTVPLSNFAVGSTVKIGRCPRGLGVNGTWIVQSAAGTTYTFFGFPALTAAVVLEKASYAQQISYVFNTIAPNVTSGTPTQLQSTITRSSKHAVGRPPVAPTGRRKVRRA